MPDIYNALPIPDDRPITALCVVEEISGCPPNYTVVCRTHDQDIDADLCKDGFFRRITRYLCHSKAEGFFGYVIENIMILNDKESRPPGYTVLEQTSDTNQKAFKKKQLCYKAVPRNAATQTITDIIILSRSKVAPEGFTLFGEMNGLSVCYKLGPATALESFVHGSPSALPYSVNPNHGRGSVSSVSSGLYPDVQRLRQPSRQAPTPPAANEATHPLNSSSEYSSYTLYESAQSSLSGIPFVFNKKYVETSSPSQVVSNICSKSRQQVDDDYYYSFALEQDVLQRAT